MRLELGCACGPCFARTYVVIEVRIVYNSYKKPPSPIKSGSEESKRVNNIPLPGITV